MDKKIALVLSGGAALGFAHIGVIKVLEDNGIKPDIIVGTSMGGLIGAAYSCGLSVDEMTKFGIKFKGIHFVDLNFNTSGIFSGNGLMRRINKFLPDKKIEDLDIKFACVACDLYSEKQVVFQSGSIRDAVRSTVSIPGLFVPFKKDKMLLVDGGIVNNMPEDVAKDLGADIIISVNVLDKCRVTRRPKTAIDTILAAMNISTKTLQNCNANCSDIVLNPDLGKIRQMSFSKDSVLYAIEQGKKETKAHIKEILNLIK